MKLTKEQLRKIIKEELSISKFELKEGRFEEDEEFFNDLAPVGEALQQIMPYLKDHDPGGLNLGALPWEYRAAASGGMRAREFAERLAQIMGKVHLGTQPALSNFIKKYSNETYRSEDQSVSPQDSFFESKITTSYLKKIILEEFQKLKK